MGRPIEICVESKLTADRAAVWQHASSMTGVNFELGPYVKMTSPPGGRVLPDDAAAGRVVAHSWVLLFGVVPFDRHAFGFERVDQGSGFVEESSSWLHRRWRHERTLTDAPGGGCVIADRLVIEPRLGFTRPIVAMIVERLFTHRHRRLERRFDPTGG